MFAKRTVTGVPEVGLPSWSSFNNDTQPLRAGAWAPVQIGNDWNVEPAASGLVTIVRLPLASAANNAADVVGSRLATVMSKVSVAIWLSVGVLNENWYATIGSIVVVPLSPEAAGSSDGSISLMLKPVGELNVAPCNCTFSA